MSTSTPNITRAAPAESYSDPIALGGSALSSMLSDVLRTIHRPTPSSHGVLAKSVHFKPLRDDKRLRLFNIAAGLKVAVSEVSMHLPSDWRRRLFEKIDQLHEPDDWEDSDTLADMESFKTFLHTVLEQGPMYRMSLGIDNSGHILAGWRRGQDTLSFIFLPSDKVRWSLVQHIDDNMETASGLTTVRRLPLVLKPHSPEVWFGNAANNPAR
jgi:hypothetical protein